MTSPPAERRPVSFVQRTLWLDHQLADQSAAYNLVLAIRIDSPYDTDRLTAAVDRVVARHGLLHECFVEIQGTPYRSTADPAGLRLEVVDPVRGQADQAIREFIDRPFDLRRNVARFGLIRLGPDEAVLLPVVHHIAGDYTSHWILVRDLIDAYHDRPLTDPGGSFDEAVDAEQRLLAAPVSAESVAFWTDRADGPATELPPDRARPALPRQQGDCHRVRLSPDLVDQLPRRAAELGVTSFAVLLGAFTALVHRFSATEDVLIGCPASSRRGRRQRGIVGPFINPVPIRARFTDTTTLRDTVTTAHRQLIEGLVHLRYPCGALPGGAPAYRIAVLLVDARSIEPQLPAPIPGQKYGAGRRFGDLTLSLQDVASQGGQLDLVVRLEQGHDGIDMVCGYDTDLFDRATIERFAAAFETVLTDALQKPDRLVADVPLTDGNELAQLLALGAQWDEVWSE